MDLLWLLLIAVVLIIGIIRVIQSPPGSWARAFYEVTLLDLLTNLLGRVLLVIIDILTSGETDNDADTHL